MYVIIVSILIVLAYFYYAIKKKQSYWAERKIKYIKPKFFLGSFTEKEAFPLAIQRCYNAFPNTRYHGVYQFLQPTIMLRDPELIKQISIKDFDHFVDHRAVISPKVDSLWDRNLFARKGEEWRDMRATLSPSFTLSKMRGLFHLIDEIALNFVKFYENETKDGSTIELEMKDSIRRYTNDVIASAAFGITVNSLKDRENDFFKTGFEMTDFTGFKLMRFVLHAVSPILSKLFRIRVISKRVADYFTAIIMESIKAREEQNIVRNDMIQLLLGAKKGRESLKEDEMQHNEGFFSHDDAKLAPKTTNKIQITTDDIISQAMIFFLAGFDTVSNLMTFAIYELAVNPDVQNKLRAEVLAHPEKPTYESILKLKYLDMVVSEALRKWPAAVFTDRLVTKAYTIEPTEPDEVPLRLEEGISCWLPIYAIQRDPKNFPNPDKFDPERFSDENKGNINPSAYIPFGIGPRLCIGSRFALLESKLLIFYIIKRFEIVPIKRTLIPMVLDPKNAVLGAKGGMWLGLKLLK